MKNSLNSSYFFAIDHVHGWGNRSYFTFFSEFDRPWVGIAFFEAIILCAIFIISVVTNLIIIVRVIRVQQLKTVTNCFLANLAVADILFATGCPIIAIVRVTESWIFGQFLCNTLIYIEFVCMFSVIWTMTVISIDRFICIVKPTSSKITVKMALVIIFILWLFSLSVSIPMAVYFYVKSIPSGGTTIKICTLVWPKNDTIQISIMFVASLFFLGFILPLTIMTYSYYKVFQTFWASRKTIERNESKSKSNVSETIVMQGQPSGIKMRNIRSYRVIRILVLLVLLFLFMWLPIFVAFIGIQHDGMGEHFKMHSWMLLTCSIFAFGNTCVNPFIYVFINERFRLNFWWCWKNNEQKFPTEEQGSLTLSAS